MADILTVEAGTTSATPSGDPGAASQSPLSSDDIRTVAQEVVQAENNRLWAAMRRPMQEQQGATAGQLAQMQQALTDATNRSAVLTAKLLETASSPEEVQAILKTEADRVEASRLAAERDYYKAQAEAKPVDTALTPRQVLDEQYQTTYAPFAERLGKSEGIAWKDLVALDGFPTINEGAGAREWDGWLTKVEKLAKGEADRRLKAEKPPVAVPSLATAGAPPERDKNNFRNLSKWWADNPNG